MRTQLILDPIEKARAAAELAEFRAREDRARLVRKATRLQIKSLTAAEEMARLRGRSGRDGRKRGGRGGPGGRGGGEPWGGGGGEPRAFANTEGFGSGGGPGGYKSEVWSRTRPDTGRGRGGSAQSFLTESVRRRIRIDCQTLDRRVPLARGMVSRSCDLANSHGFSVQAGSKDAKWNKAVESWFSGWSRKTGYEAMGGAGCDLCGQKTLAHYTYQVDHSMHVDGDVGVVFTEDGSLQAIESERIMNPLGTVDSDSLRGGVELDGVGRPIKYHVCDWMPLGSFPRYMQTYAIAAEHFALLTNPTRARFGAWRGEPSMAAVIDRFEHLDETAEAVRMAFFVAACQAMLISTDQPGIEQGLAAGETVNNQNGTTERHEYIEPAQIRRISPNTKVTQFQPTQPSTNYEILRMAEVIDIAADAGLPVVLMLLDFRQVNYSSARSATIVAFRYLRRRQQYLIDAFLSRVYRWRVAMAIRRGEIPGFDAGYVPEGWDQHEWTPPAPPVLDVLTEVQAAKLAVESRLKPRKRVMGELWGTDFTTETDQMSAEEKELAQKGILPVAQPGATDPNAAPPPADANTDPNAVDENGDPISPEDQGNAPAEKA